MSTRPTPTAPSYEDLQRENAELRAQVAELQARSARLEAALVTQQAELAAAKRQQHRQAAPFSTGERVSQPKRPGRRPGGGRFEYRRAPEAAAVTGMPVAVPVTSAVCPRCGGTLEPPTVEPAWVTDLPESPRPQVTEYRVAVCRCQRCGRVVRGTHPDVAADQYGATAHRLGQRLLATAHVLHYGLGVPQRKVPAVLQAVAGAQVTQSALAQDAQRRTAGAVGAVYQELRAELREAPAVHTDDTGWRVGGAMAFLMVFRSLRTTVYQIRPRHRNEEVRELIPGDYAGVVITDGGRSYDAKALAEVQQQKCLSHLLRGAQAVLVTKRGRGRSFAKQLKALLAEALALRRAQRTSGLPDYAERVRDIEQRLTHHLHDRVVPDRDNQRLLDEVGRHHDKGQVLRFLHNPQVEPTNNIAERALRPAVIARKVSQCSKTDRGADSFAAFISLCQTFGQRGIAPVTGLTALFRSGHLPLPSATR